MRIRGGGGTLSCKCKLLHHTLGAIYMYLLDKNKDRKYAKESYVLDKKKTVTCLCFICLVLLNETF